MSYSTTNYLTVPTSPNPYVSRKLNNIEEARMMKEERNNWMKMYHKTLKGLEAMIDVQKQVRDMMKIVAEMNTMITEMEDTILKASCCSNHLPEWHLWFAYFSKALSWLSSSGDYKRTQQEALAALLLYLYKLHVVCATTISSCPNVHASSSCPITHSP